MATETPESLVYTWEPSNAAIARRYGLRPDQVLRFDTNTSPLPPNELVAARLAEPFDPTLNEYPDSSYEELTAAIAAYNGVAPERILVGAGADEVLDCAAKAFLPAGGAAILPAPTYGMYAVLTGQRAARVLTVPRLGAARGYGLDVPAIVAALRTGVGYLGALGSRRTHGERIERLREEGVTERALARLHGPIGLDLGARTPEETAIAICAEIIAERTGRQAPRLTDTTGPIHR